MFLLFTLMFNLPGLVFHDYPQLALSFTLTLGFNATTEGDNHNFSLIIGDLVKHFPEKSMVRNEKNMD